MRTFLFLFLLSFSVRLGTLFLIPQDQIPPNPNWETGAVSISLATTGEFADPYLIPTGPTAHMPPLYVAAMSLVYRVLGTGFVGGLVRWILIMVAYSILWALMPWLGESLGVGRKAGILGGLVGALFVTFPSELESFSALALAMIAIAFFLRWKGNAESGGRKGNLLLMGLAVGIVFHLQPVLLVVVLGYMVFELWWYHDRRGWRPVGLMALGILLACLPWGVRNYATFHQLYFIRSNLGLELYVGNHDGAHADIDVSAARGSFQHPRTDQTEALLVLELGEGPYMAEKQREAVAWIWANPGEFLKLTGTRILYFWAGPLHRRSEFVPYLVLALLALVGVWRVYPFMEVPQRAALLIPLATYPIVYYVVAYIPRYGEPVRWVLFLLAAAAVVGPDQARAVGKPTSLKKGHDHP